MIFTLETYFCINMGISAFKLFRVWYIVANKTTKTKVNVYIFIFVKVLFCVKVLFIFCKLKLTFKLKSYVPTSLLINKILYC